jgi:hypothetical protein
VNITIPATIEEATTGLDGIGKLLTAKEWERAAIVYAFTNPAQGQRNVGATAPKLSIRAFAALGITGLRHHTDVTAYRKAWESAILDGAPEAVPGVEIELPSLPWTSHLDGTNRSQEAVEDRTLKRILKDPERFAKLVEEPEVADLVIETVVRTPATRWRAQQAVRQLADEPLVRHPEPKPAGKAIESVINAITSFWDHPINHNGREMTYRQVIEIVRDNPDAVLQASLAPTASLHVGLARALDGMATEARRLADPLMIKAGSDE